MKKAKKVLLLVLCAALLVGATVAGTLAYLTDQDDVTNTFTVGNVQIKLDEPVVDKETGKVIDPANRTEDGNTDVRMIPGRVIDKEPTVTVLENSEGCYVRVKVTVDVSAKWTNDSEAIAAGLIGNGETFANWASSFANDYLLHDTNTGAVNGFNTDNWTVTAPAVDTDAKTITYTLTYKNDTNNIVAKDTENDTVLEAVFNNVKVPQNLTNAQLALLEGMQIKVEANAIQAEGFVATDEKTAEQNAWDAFDN